MEHTLKNIEAHPHIVYYNDNHIASHDCTESLSNSLRATWSMPSTWRELVDELEKVPENLVFHIDMIVKSVHSTPTEFIDAVRTIVKFIPRTTPLKIAVIITPHTPLSMVRELQRAGILAIGLDVNHYPVEEVATAVNALVNGIPYWPKHILDTLPSIVDNNKKTILFYHPDRYSRPNAIEADAHFKQHIPCNFISALTWEDFVAKLDYNPDLVGFHCNMFDHDASQASALITTVQETLKIKNSTAKIFVTIDKDTTKEDIRVLKKSNIAGIQTARLAFDIDRATKSFQELLNCDSYWPDDVISQLPDALPLSIYFRADWRTYITPKIYEGIKKVSIFDVAYCSDWCELGEVLNRKPHQIIFHITMLERLECSITEIMAMITTKLKLAGLDIPIAVGIDPDVPVSTIKELRRAGVFGLTFSAAHWGGEETARGMLALRDRKPYWPKHIIDQLPGSKKKSANSDKIVLTARQGQVFKYITERGSSNKAIAKSLGISESTVKLHLTEIFKKYGVRNRTQLAVFSNVS